ncbi:phage tail protein [Candidatus Uabimicrobium sp. HlEnr_7]|uniref:phage tail protein n=1 Tax=Candidatus Uabimicrobium helgolandensis TaxID=3095367 RepID=UPI003558F6FB
MATGERLVDPYRNFRFRVEIEDIEIGGFSDVTIPDSSSDVVEYREGTEPPYVRKLSGLNKYGVLTLKKGITDSLELYKWREQIEDTGAKDLRKNISLILIDEEGAEKSRWEIIEAWCSKIEYSGLSAKGNEVLIETLEITHERMDRVS